MPDLSFVLRPAVGFRPAKTGFSAALVVCALHTLVGASQADAGDWTQFQGPDRNNRSAETDLLPSWPEGGPELAWSFENAGLGYSSPSIAGGRVYLLGSRENKTELICLSSANGEELWSLPLNEESFDFEGNSWGAGPRSTVTIDGESVYALAGDGVLACVTTDGELKWKVNLISDFGGSIKSVDAGEPETFGWGFCWGPLIDGENLICTPGSTDGSGLVMALNKKTGEVVWRSGELNEESTYASPVIATIGGVKQYVTMTQFGIASVDPTGGSLLWYHKRKRPYSDVVIPTPVCEGDYVYSSTGDGCELLKVTKGDDGFEVEAVYTSRKMKNAIGGFVLHEGHIYGTSDRRGWVCQDLLTGKLAWYQRANRSVGDGSLIYADGRLYLYGEKTAEVSLIEASSEGWSEKGRFSLPAASENPPPSGKNWTRPAIAGGLLFLRDQELLFCYRVKQDKS